MHDNTMAVSTSAIKDYQKKVAILYSDFIKTMNSHLREEKEVRKEFTKLRKEKLLNSQFSLYRSDGADLFSKATENRSKLMENFVRMSPVVLDDFHNYTPWGLDMIIDEDLIAPSTGYDEEIRPLTAPVPIIAEEPEPQERPNTVLPNAFKDTVNLALSAFTSSLEFENLQHQSSDSKHVINIEPKHATSTELKHMTSNTESKQNETGHWRSIKAAVTEKNGDELPEEDLEAGIDGHVDMKLDQTKARKIMIRAKKFDELTKGGVCVKLKEKCGQFVLKPAPTMHQIDAVQAYFMAKDPNKEQMALVRKKTSHFSPTVSSDMKINNKIPIMKSLLGHKVKKTTVAEIMSEARNRKTRQYKVCLRNYKQLTSEQDEHAQQTVIQSPRSKSAQCSPRNETNDVNTDPILSERNLKRQLHQDLEKHNMDIIQNRIKVVMEAWGKNESPRPPSVIINTDSNQKTSPSDMVFRSRSIHDVREKSLSSSQHRVKFSDEHNQVPLNRSASSMSFKGSVENMQTDTMRLMVDNKRPDSRSESSLSYATGYGSINKLPRRSKTPNRRFPSRFTPVSSDSYSEISIDAPSKFLSTKDAHKMVKEQIKRDKEKESALFSLRRRMATAASAKR